jgi:drug/metabolite transporter (DMT)-like permease
VKSRLWLVYALITMTFFGVWGALIETTEKAGFPATLGYVVWAFMMIPPALVALKIIGWKLDRDLRSVALGLICGFTGTGGQLILFQTLAKEPAYLVFPIISLSPVVTIILSMIFLKERASKTGWIGISLALIAMPLLSYQPSGESDVRGYLWLAGALIVFLAWGVQSYVLRLANRTMKAESIFVYMMIAGLLLIPIALLLTDFSKEINWGFKGPYLAAIIQILNAVGALFLVYAFRHGKAIIVSPMINALAPVITVVISLLIYAYMPHPLIATGLILALAAAFLMSREEAEAPPEEMVTDIPFDRKKT